MSRFWSLAALVVGGIIVADILIHPAGTQAAANGISTVSKPTYNALLGIDLVSAGMKGLLILGVAFGVGYYIGKKRAGG